MIISYLSPQDGFVRYEAAHGVLSLYKARENVPQLAEFKGRFEKRFREMSRDADERVAIKAVSLRLPHPIFSLTITY